MLLKFVLVLILIFPPSAHVFAESLEHKDITTPPIIVQGNKFFDSVNGKQFFIKGLAYQRVRNEGELFDPSIETPYIDSLADADLCLRDIENFKDLGVNVLRVYQINPESSHDVCMEALSKAKIYVFADLLEPHHSINRNAPYWLVELFERYKSVVDAMHKYDNLLGFFVGNEVTTSKANTDALPFVRAAVRDIRKYIAKKKYRPVPLGYATNDDAEIRLSISNYFVCDNKNDGAIDFLGLNMYEWCGYSTYSTSGYRERTIEFSDFPVPIFFSEYGCNSFNPRPFTEVEALYGPSMSKVWSGGLAYEYFDNINHYGLVKLDLETRELTRLEDFQLLKNKLNSVDPVGFKSDQQVESPAQIECKSNLNWKALSTLPLTPDSGKCDCIQSSFSCIVSPFESINEEQLLNKVCSQVDCSEIMANGEAGSYGRLSDCRSLQRLSYALNEYYLSNKTCDFNGRAVLVTNNDEADLTNIYTLDGRTCSNAIANFSTSYKTTQRNKTNTLGSTHTFLQDRANGSKKLNSLANTAFESISTLVSKFLSVACLFLIMV